MTERNHAVDFIRLISIIGVVLIHTTTYFVDRNPAFSLSFYFLHALNQAVRFAVPLFFAISGFLLAGKYSNIFSPGIFYKKRFGKILLPYFVWSLIYFLIIFPNPVNLVFSKIFLYNLLTGDSSYQLYFIPTIIVLYLAFPFIMYFRKIFLSLWFIAFLTLIETIVLSYYYYTDSNPQIISAIPIAFYNLLPFVLGIFAAVKIKDLREFVKTKVNFFIIPTFLSWFLIFFESVLMFKITGHPMHLRTQWRITVVAYGMNAGALFYYFYRDRWNRFVSYLSPFAFGVFFIHVAILHNLMKIMDTYKLHNLFWFMVILVTTTFLSFMFSIGLSKVKILNRLLGLRS